MYCCRHVVGFLSSGGAEDSSVEGNYALHDIRAALGWIQETVLPSCYYYHYYNYH